MGETVAATGIRHQIQTLPMENIADLALEASTIEGLIPLWYGEGDLVTPSFIRDAAKRAFDEGNTFYVPNMRGLPALWEALTDYQTRLHGVTIAPRRTTVTPGGMQALVLALLLIADAGDNIVYVEPQWPNIRSVIHLVGAEPRPVALDYRKDDWQLDLGKLTAACDKRTRAIFLSTPSNPSGWTATREELNELRDFSRRTGIWIICDEVYGRLYFEGDVAPSILQVADSEDRVFAINSFSKAWAMTGWRVGWLTHPASVADQISAMTQYINSGTAVATQFGALAAVTEGESLVHQIRERCRVGRDLAYERLAGLDNFVFPTPPRGGMYVFFSLRGEPDSREACRRILQECRVGVAPGYLFGKSAAGSLRLCICRSRDPLETAFERMAASS